MPFFAVLAVAESACQSGVSFFEVVPAGGVQR